MADPATLARDLRAGVGRLAAMAADDLAVVWESVRTPVDARVALLGVLPPLIDRYGAAAASLAADWYDEYRAVAGVRGVFRAVPVEIGDTGTSGLARWGLGPVFDAQPEWERARVMVDGGVQKRIANAARQTVMQASVADPAALGWQRVGDGHSCLFCQMLIGRGAVYQEKTALFAAHDHCGCEAVPAFGGQPLPVEPYTPTDRNVTDADRARVRAWIANNLGSPRRLAGLRPRAAVNARPMKEQR